MSSTASASAGEPATTCPRRHHAVELELNACGVECCPHDAHKGLVAVASYLHRPGDEDTPQSRVGQLYLYDLRPSGDARNADVDDADAHEPQTDWSFARVAAPERSTHAQLHIRVPQK